MAAEYLDDVDRACFVATARAVNRLALGLPLDHPSTDAEISDMARIDRAMHEAGTRVTE